MLTKQKAILAFGLGFVPLGYAVLVNGEIVNCGCLCYKRWPAKATVRAIDQEMDKRQSLALEIRAVIELHNVAAIIVQIPSSRRHSANLRGLLGATAIASVAATLSIPLEVVAREDVQRMIGNDVPPPYDVINFAEDRWSNHPLPKNVRHLAHVASALATYACAESGTLCRMLKLSRCTRPTHPAMECSDAT